MTNNQKEKIKIKKKKLSRSNNLSNRFNDQIILVVNSISLLKTK